MEKIVIAYVPVLHDGYKKFFEKHKDAVVMYILGKDLISQVQYLSKEIRELDPELMAKAVESLHIGPDIQILTEEKIKDIAHKKLSIVMPDEDVGKVLAEKYFSQQANSIFFDTIFLRWDKHNTVTEKPVVPDSMISRRDFDKKIMKHAQTEAEKSSDWWRRVGAVLIKDGEIILEAHNNHVPSEHTPYVHGDPRNAFSKGVNLELSTVIHSEAWIVAEAARRGISLEGTDMYVTTFPCPPCAKQIAYAGIKNLYCGGGYGVLDGQDVLNAKGVKIFFVEQDQDENVKEKKWEGYKK